MQTDLNPMHKRLCGLGVFLVVGGAIAFVGAMIGQARMNATASWPSVSGRITVSELSTATVKTGPVVRVTPVAKIRFEYAVNGRAYLGDSLRVTPMLHSEPEGSPTELVSRYPVGRAVDVYFDPNNPGDSLLIPRAAAGARNFTQSLSFLGVSVALVGLLMTGVGGIQLYRSRAESSEPEIETVEEEVSVVVEETPPPAPVVSSPVATTARTTHWLIRTVATLLGLVFFLFGSLLFLASLTMNKSSVSASVEIVARCIFFGFALLGAGLVYFGMKK